MVFVLLGIQLSVLCFVGRNLSFCHFMFCLSITCTTQGQIQGEAHPVRAPPKIGGGVMVFCFVQNFFSDNTIV